MSHELKSATQLTQHEPEGGHITDLRGVNLDFDLDSKPLLDMKINKGTKMKSFDIHDTVDILSDDSTKCELL